MRIQRSTAGPTAAVVSLFGLSASLNTLLSTPTFDSAIDGVKASGPKWNRAASDGSFDESWAPAGGTPPRHTSSNAITGERTRIVRKSKRGTYGRASAAVSRPMRSRNCRGSRTGLVRGACRVVGAHTGGDAGGCRGTDQPPGCRNFAAVDDHVALDRLL